MGLFTISFIAYMYDRDLLRGAIGLFALFTGCMGLGMMLITKIFAKPEYDDVEDTEGEGETDAEAEESDDAETADGAEEEKVSEEA